jgi:pimeloyl-ACP methyl ester carboxylesterase
VGSSHRRDSVLIDRTFTVPLDHERPDGELIEIYAREVRAEGETGQSLPWLLFLGGGPGCPAPRPLGGEGWLERALREYRVLLLDQRGTGRSTPADRRTLAFRGGPAAQAEYLAHFRADAIVRDAERIRRALAGGESWTVLGQSFGGFCVTTYLSLAPEGLAEAFVTGGLPGIEARADEVYRATYPRVAAANAAHYARHPEDRERALRVARYLRDHDVRLPGGRPLTVETFQSLGTVLGRGDGSRRLHYLLEDAFAGGRHLSDAFLHKVDGLLSATAAAPLYSVLHEATYAQGEGATRWSAQRIMAEHPEFDATEALRGHAPLLFTGEMIYPWMFDTDPVLQPLREVAHLLADRRAWPGLYDPARLAANTVPVTAAVYRDDMYVDHDLSMATARAVRGLRPWVTDEYHHDGLRTSNGEVLDHLLELAHGRPGAAQGARAGNDGCGGAVDNLSRT